MIKLSVIIPTRNRATLLKKTLQSLLLQTISKDVFEVIVVNNDSTDDTEAVSEIYSGKFMHYRCIKELKPGLHEGRHAGLKVAKGEILVYTDDDIEAYPEWLEGVAESFKDQDVGLVGGKNIPKYESDPPQWLEKLWEKTPYGKFFSYFSLLDFGDKVMEVHPDFIFGCNFSIRKDVLIKIGGFHPDGMPDSLLKFRGDGETFVATQVKLSGYKVMYDPRASLRHWVPNSRMSLEYLKKRVFLSGVGSSYAHARANGLRPRRIHAVISRLKRLKRIIMASGIQKDMLRAFYQGYDFHQSEMERDPELRLWVFKDSYLSEGLEKSC